MSSVARNRISSTESPQLSCSICLETYKSPRYLECLHFFCQNCLQGYIQQRDTRTISENGIACPVCRKLTKIPNTEGSASDIAKRLPANNLLSGLREDEAQLCDTCQRDKTSVIAKSFCVQCQERLCEECSNYHRKFKTTRKHDLITNPDTGTEYQSLITETETCLKHLNETFTFYCHNHDCFCCNTCAILDHRGCEIIREIEEDQAFVEIDELKDRLTQCKDEFDKIIHVTQDNLQYLEQQESQVAEKVVAARTKVMDYFADAKNKIDIQSKQFFSGEKDRNHTQSKRCKKMIAAIDSSSDMFEKTEQLGSERQKFIMKKRIETQCEQYEKSIHDEIDRIRRVEIRLDIDRVVDGLLLEQKVESRITLVRRPVLYPSRCSHPSRCYSRCMTVQTIKENPEEPRYTGATFLPNGNLVLIDQINSKCVVFDSHYHFLVQQSLSASPFKVAVIGYHEVAVTLKKDTRILILKIKTTIKEIREIPTPRPCWCLLPIDDNRLAVVWDGEDNPSFGIIDHQGNELVHFSQTKDGRRLKKFRHLGIDTINGRVIQPCCVDEAVYCFKFDGTPDFVYCHDDLKQPAGVAVDKNGEIYICSYETHSIHRLTSDGQLVRIIRARNMLKPLIANFNEGEEFVVTVDNPGDKETLHIFRPLSAATTSTS